MDLLVAILVILFSLFIGLIPFAVVYPLADLLAFLFHRVIKYRRKVVESNLRAVFPDHDEAELRSIRTAFYRNLGDVMIEGIKSFTISSGQVIKRHKLLNPDLLEPYVLTGQSVIVCPRHCANWEWGSISGALQIPQRNVVMYKPLVNGWLDKYLRWTRARFGTYLASIYKTAAVFERFSPGNSLFILAADQSPSNLSRAIWVRFLGRPTAFLHGPEFYARKHGLPVFYVDIRRVRRGYYELTLEPIAERPGELPEGEITQRYAGRLEGTILRSPADWLWSHRRWKHGPPRTHHGT